MQPRPFLAAPPGPFALRAAAWAACLGLVSAAGHAGEPSAAEAAAPPTTPPALTAMAPARERLRDFFDSLADVALTLNRLQVYRRFGQRREVDLAPHTVLSLDEQQPALLSNPSGRPFVSTSPLRLLQVDVDHAPVNAFVGYERGEGSRGMHWGGLYRLEGPWSLTARGQDLRSEQADVPGDPVIGLRRRDTEAGLRWQGAWGDAGSLEVDAGWRHAELTPSLPSAGTPAGSADYALVRGTLASERWHGLSLAGVLAQPLRRDAAADPTVNGARAEATLQWQLGPGHALPGLPEGSRLAWREAPRLSVLADDEALTPRAAYRRHVGLDVPDGSPGGATFAQWRQHSLASADDTAFLLGWRHGWRPEGAWPVDTRIEQVWPLGGPDAERATQVGLHTWRDDFPHRAITVDSNAVRTTQADSQYVRSQFIQRLADDWLGALQAQASHAQPREEPDAAIDQRKAAIALAWREPEARRLHLLTRFSLDWRDTAPLYHDPTVRDQRGWLWMGHAAYRVDPQATAALRLARRTAHDDSPGQPTTRQSNLWLARWTETVPGTRWSLSGHLARRRDTTEGDQTGFGAEIGWSFSGRVALALGFNPRGFSDNDLTLDERPQRGVVLRLRFSVEGVLDRWLDAGRRDGPAGTGRNGPSVGYGLRDLATGPVAGPGLGRSDLPPPFSF